MKLAAQQKGFSLSNLLVIGFLLITVIVYGRNAFGLIYHAYKVKAVMNNIVTVEKTETDARAKFDQLIAFEGLKSVKGEDLEIVVTDAKVQMSLSYKECGSITDNWEVCATWNLETK